jgi:hypothetical protein
MPAQRERTEVPGGQTASVLARRLSEAASSNGRANGNGHAHANGNGRTEAGTVRKLAVEHGAAMLADASAGTAEHSDDVVLITEAIGERLGIAGEDARDLLAAARLHDIGKACIPKGLLEKSGPLTDEEWALMRQHTVIGEQILGSVPELETVARLVRGSHERWDGGGYPDGLAGPEIPLGSRIIFCADAFHAIRSDRPYRRGRPANEALAEVSRCAGTQFDPNVVAALQQVRRERTRRPGAKARSSRLLALLMCLVIGGAGTAIARSGVLGEGGGSPLPTSEPKPPPACGTAGCPTVAEPVGSLASVWGAGRLSGPRALHPGLPGHRKGGSAGTAQGSGTQEVSRGRSQGAKQENHGKGSGNSGQSHRHSQSKGSQGSHGGGSNSHSNGNGKASGGKGSGGHQSGANNQANGGEGSSGQGGAGSKGQGGGSGSQGNSGNAGGSGSAGNAGGGGSSSSAGGNGSAGSSHPHT